MTSTQILNGPSKFDLMVSLFEGNPTPRKTANFKIDSGKRIPQPGGREPVVELTEVAIAITMVEQESGCGESWIFEGHTTGKVRGNVKGYYSSQTRKGHYSFMPRY